MSSANISTPSPEPATVADAYLKALAQHGVEWLFCNAGTDFPPLVEAYERAYRADDKVPAPILVPHENVAIGMAYGAALVTGQPQFIMVHVGVGTANAVCGLFNAARQHVPLVLTAGRTPVLEQGRLGARNNYINWAQEMFDQGGMVRELVKWDYELRDPAQIDAVVDRAYVASASSPQGPAYLVLPREVLSAPAAPAVAAPARVCPAASPRARADDIDTLATWLVQAKHPVIVTSDVGRSEEAFHKLAAFAQKWAIPVAQYRPRFANMPTAHPMHAGYNPGPWVSEADCVLVLESDVPWLPDECAAPLHCKVVQVGRDPLYMRYPIRSFPSDLSMVADVSLVIDDLDAALDARLDPGSVQIRQRLDAVAARTRVLQQPADLPADLSHRYVSRCLAGFFDDNTVLINEYPFNLEEFEVTRPSRFYSHSPAGGLGWATGTALGIKLAAPHLTVIATVGDGSYMFGNPTPAHFVSRAMDLPILTVVFNNRRWAAVHRATLSMFPDGMAARSENPPLSSLEPSPEYERIVEASGGLGIRVERADQLQEAFAQALAAVKAGRQAVVNVLTEVSYTRTS